MSSSKTLRESLEADIITAMKDRNQARLDALRFLKSAIQMEEKAKLKTLDEAAVLQVVVRQVNDRREAIRMFTEGKRDDLVANATGDFAVLEAYLPPQMSRDEVVALLRQAIGEVGAICGQDTGKVMGKLMLQVRGKADGVAVNSIVV